MRTRLHRMHARDAPPFARERVQVPSPARGEPCNFPREVADSERRRPLVFWEQGLQTWNCRGFAFGPTWEVHSSTMMHAGVFIAPHCAPETDFCSELPSQRQEALPRSKQLPYFHEGAPPETV